MAYQLTQHQQEKLDEVIALLKKGHKRILVKGSAGCGKTVLAMSIVEKCLKDNSVNPRWNNNMVFVTAPTNKALSILQQKITHPVEFKTIHSALKLKRWIDSRTGLEVFVKSNNSYGKKMDEFYNCRVAIIDECSMLSSAFIGGAKDHKGVFQRGYLDDLQIPIIFIGDEKQLNPVNEDYSPAFHQGWPEIELTEIIRQGNGNPIIELSRDLAMINFKRPKLIDGKGYLFDNDKASIIDKLAEVNGTDELKYLAYTNAEVDEMNKFVRQRRYGNPNKIEKEETIVFNTPFAGFFTNQEVKVYDLDVFVENIRLPRHDTVFDRENQPISKTDELRFRFYKINDKINIIHEDSHALFSQISAELKKSCMNRGWDWRGFYWFCEQFADIKYNHALSIHKSQGSTYKKAVINIGDVNRNRNLPEKQRMLYTAVTRASDLVVLNNVK